MIINQTVVNTLYILDFIRVYNDIAIPIYGSLMGAENYFAKRLRTKTWKESSTEEKVASLIEATRIIDSLNYRGTKTDSSQPLEFPRTLTNSSEDCNSRCTNNPDLNSILNITDSSSSIIQSSIPNQIEIACYEIALCLLEGYDPDLEIENLGSNTQGIGGIRDTYDRSFVLEHIRAGVPSALAWSYLKPFLIDPHTIRVSRVN